MEALGIDLKLIAFQMVNFLILMFILKKFLYKPILDMLEKRRKLAQETVSLKEDLERKMEDVGKEKEAVLMEAKKESDSVIESAKEQAEKLAAQIEKEASEKAMNIVQKGEETLRAKEQELRASLKNEVAKIAVETSEQVLAKSLDEDIKRDIAEESIRRFAQNG